MSVHIVDTPPVEPDPHDSHIERPAQILRWRGVTKLHIDPDTVLQAAIGKLKTVVVIGYDADGDEYFASSEADGADVLWHLERAKQALLNL